MTFFKDGFEAIGIWVSEEPFLLWAREPQWENIEDPRTEEQLDFLPLLSPPGRKTKLLLIHFHN